MAVLRSKEQYQQWVTFYESVQGWPEAKANAGFKFPKLVFYGADSVTTTGGVTVGYAVTLKPWAGASAKSPATATASDSTRRSSYRWYANSSTRRFEVNLLARRKRQPLRKKRRDDYREMLIIRLVREVKLK